MGHVPEKKFPLNPKDYKLYEEVGDGVSATVYRSLCIPLNEIVAIKVLDLEKCNNDLDGIRREVQTMSTIDHPNLLQAHCSFAAGHSLWVVMPYMAGGSCLHIMKSAFQEGFEEPVIAGLLREVLKALVYLHCHGHIHRDVKSGNILVDTNGAVKLADFGVSACMFDAGDRQRSRNTFVGTPCWMAPEVMQQLHGYDFKADIWSFGITALELAHGHAPFSKYPPMKVLLMTLQNAPPGLDYERDRRFSKSFKDLVAACLVKDPKKRPTSEKLLKHAFFKNARSNEYLIRTILHGLSPLGDRFRTLKEKEAEFLVQNKAMYGDKEQLSQQEYMRGISAWNFNLEDLRNQAALIQDFDEISNIENLDTSSKQEERYDNVGFAPKRPSPERVNHSNAEPSQEDELNDLQNLESSFASFPIHPIQALKGYFDVGDNDVNPSSSPNCKDSSELNPEQQLLLQPSPRAEEQESKKNDWENSEGSCLAPKHVFSGQRRKFFSGSLVPENVLSSSRKVADNGDREYMQSNYQTDRNYSGSLLYRQKRETNNQTSVEDTSEGAVVQQKGRFKITSAEVNPMVTNCLVNSFSGGSTSPTTPTVSPASVLQFLQYILQANTIQRDQILKLIKCLEEPSGHQYEVAEVGTSASPQTPPTSLRERELHGQVVHLQQRVGSAVEELQRLKMKNAQLERQLNSYKEEESI